MKIKQFGKNVRALKKLVEDEKTQIILDGFDFKYAFKNLIGYNYRAEKTETGLNLIDCIGGTIEIITDLPIEMI